MGRTLLQRAAHRVRSMAATDRPYDIVLFGATGFTGALTAEYLAANAGPQTRWALAGRNQAKLDELAARLGGDPETLTADVTDPASLRRVAESARVRHHHRRALHPLRRAAGRRLRGGGHRLRRPHRRAGVRRPHVPRPPRARDADRRAAGARLRLRLDPARPRRPVHRRAAARGRADRRQGLRVGRRHRVGRHVRLGRHGVLARPQDAAGPRRARPGRAAARGPPRADDRRAPRARRTAAGRCRCRRSTRWWSPPRPARWTATAPTSATATTSRVGNPLVAAALPVGVAGVFALAQLPPTRKAMLKLRPSGSGPTPEQREKSWFRVRFVGEGGGRRVVTQVSGGDPGYGETSKMLAESALCLAHDDLPRHRRPGHHGGRDGARAARAPAARRDHLRGALDGLRVANLFTYSRVALRER